MISRRNFLGLIFEIPFVHDVQERHKFARFGVLVVHAVGNGDKSDIVLAEHHFRIKSCFKVVAPQSAHVLDEHRADFSGFHVDNQAFPAGAVEIAAAPSVIRIVFAVGEAMLVSVILQIKLLRRDLSRWFSAKGYQKSNGAATRHLFAAPPQFNANAQLICLNGQQSQAIDTFLNASSTDDGQVGTPYRVYLWHYLYVIQLAVFKFFISYWF